MKWLISLQFLCLVQDFLDNSSSQLTYHGLASLREGLRPNELAVFFRNNHFNTIFLHKGVVHILVTDQGYEFEKVSRKVRQSDSQQPQCTGTCNLNAKQPAISIPGSLPATTSLKMAHVIFYVDTDHGCWHAGCAQLCIESMLWNQACAWLHAHSMWVKELSCQKWNNKSTPRVTVFAECCVGEAG